MKNKNITGANKKYNTDLCNDSMSFEECELEILRHAVDESEALKKQVLINNPNIRDILSIVEDFLRKKHLICYGGTAINNILPINLQFYDRKIEIPDYDFYTTNAVEDAKELADIYYSRGYTDVEAKAGLHSGTYKVFVNFIPIADITQLNSQIYSSISKETILINGIRYAPPNFLRMSMYLELSRPHGDVSRWEKVMKRLTLLNTQYPLKPDNNCHTIDFHRNIDLDTDKSEKKYFIIRDTFINQGVIFFGGYATSLYSEYMTDSKKNIIKQIPDFDVISEEPFKCAELLREQLKIGGYKRIKIIYHKEIGEIVPEHFELKVGENTHAYIYKPIGCHSYNKITIDGKVINIASIDTILSFYLAFIYVNEPHYNKNRLLCMAKFLFDIEQKNRLEQKGLLKRFTVECYGKQKSMEEIRSEKSQKFKEFADRRGTKEYEEMFLNYNPNKKEIKKARVYKTMRLNDKNEKYEKNSKTFRLNDKNKKSAKTMRLLDVIWKKIKEPITKGI